MNKGSNVRKSLGFILIALMVVSAPAHAKFNWRVFGAVLATVGGVVSGSTGNVPIGVALIGLQGSILGMAANGSSDPNISADLQPSYAAGTASPKFCSDGTLTCPAAQALLRIEIQPIAIDKTWQPDEIAFVAATNRVIEDENLFARHTREGASVEVKKQDLRLLASSLEAAATAYDRLNQRLSLTQNDISGFQGEIGTAGLPSIEQSFWENSNLTASEVNAVAQFLATANLRLNVSSVSMGRILHEEASAIAAVK